MERLERSRSPAKVTAIRIARTFANAAFRFATASHIAGIIWAIPKLLRVHALQVRKWLLRVTLRHKA